MATQKFLSYAGLEKFWTLIKTKFASSLDVAVTETGAVFTLSDANGKTLSTENIPAASTSGAGLMTKAHVEALNAVGGNIQTAIKFEGMQFGGNEATLVGKKANVGIQYNSTNKHLEIIDLNSANNTVLTFMDAQDFVKDGLITASDVVENNGQVQLSLTFTYVDGTTDTKFINVTDLVSQYSAGNGLQLLSEAGSGMNNDKHTGTFAIKLVEGEKYLSVTGSGLATTATLMSDVDDKISAAEGRAAEDAQDKADAAQAAAIDAAAKDATTKAGNAKAEAISAAATDATTKAGNAKSEAISAAATDATTKANTAYDNALKDAKAYTNQEITKLTTGGVADALDAAKAYTDQEVGKVNTKIGTVTTGKTVVGMIADAESAAKSHAETKASDALDAAKAYTDQEVASKATNVINALKLDETNLVVDTTSGEGEAAITTFTFSSLKQEAGKITVIPDTTSISTISLAEIAALVG